MANLFDRQHPLISSVWRQPSSEEIGHFTPPLLPPLPPISELAPGVSPFKQGCLMANLFSRRHPIFSSVWRQPSSEESGHFTPPLPPPLPPISELAPGVFPLTPRFSFPSSFGSPFLRFSLSPSRKETSIRHSSPGPEVQVLPQSRILTFPLLSVRLS